MIEVVVRVPTAEEYAALRGSVGWRVPDPGHCVAALDATVVSVVAESDGAAVAMGRTVGDGVFYTFIVDLVVRPEHQGVGVGSRLLAALVGATSLRSTTGSVQLVAEERLAPFYERNGFQRVDDGLYTRRLARPNDETPGLSG